MALLKLIYLEMVGHDMSWASFHVLEVMSSAKYAQKRVGYLGAVQSFRADTEVLMLATNLLKKVRREHYIAFIFSLSRDTGLGVISAQHHDFTTHHSAPSHHSLTRHVNPVRSPS